MKSSGGDDGLDPSIERLESSIDRLEVGMISFTVVVVLGLFIELIPPFWDFWGDGDWKKLVSSSAGGVLVTIGVAGECVIAFWSYRQGRRLREENAEKDRQAKARLKLADERIAEMEKGTAEARLETEKLKSQMAWRTVTFDQRTKLSSELLAKKGSIWIEHLEGDVESQSFANHFLTIFEAAEWKVGWRACRGNLLVVGNNPSLIPPPAGSVRDEAFTFLMEAFKRADIEVAIGAGIPVWGNMTHSDPPPEPAFRLFIGAKQPIPM